MKKILNLLIVFVCVMVLGITKASDLNASSTNMLKKLFVTVGSNDTLEYPGFKLLETNINYDVEGLYSATYLEDITDRTFYREIEVIKEETLLNNGIKNINKLEEFEFKEKKILKRVITSSCNIFILEDETNVIMRFEYDDNVINLNLFDKNNFGFVDLVFDNSSNKLYLVGNLFTSSLDVYIAEYSLNGNLLKEKVILGNNVDIVKSIIVKDTSIYLSGSTTSSNQDFTHTCYQEDSYVLKINIETFEIIKYLNLGEIGIDYINVSSYLDNIYVVKHFYNNGIHVVKIYKLDDNLNIISDTYLGTITLVSDIALKNCDNDLYYFCSVYNESLNNDQTVLYKVSKDLNIKKLDTYCDKFAVGVDLNIVNNEISLLYTSYSKDENYPTYIRTITDKTIKFTLDNRIYNNCYFNELGNLDLIYNEHLKSFEYSLVYSKSFGNNDNYSDVNPVIMCNNIRILENKYLSNLYFDPNMFGVYSLIYYYNFDFFDLVIKKDIHILSDINVECDNVYNTGLILSFKGIGYLNNLIIENGYVINKPGNYELEVMGYDNKSVVYNFEVVDNLSTKEEEKFVDYEVKLKDMDNSNSNNLIVNNNIPINKIIQDGYQNKIWYVVIPIVTLLISISTFMFLGRKIK